MRIGIYNPYFDGFGGGERYTLILAHHWAEKHEVFLFWDDDSLRIKLEERFKIDLSGIKTTQNFFKSKNVLKKALLSKRYDLIFFLSDGSIPTSFAKYNILHFQIPFPHVRVNPLKLLQYQAIVCNSEFTKRHIDQRIGRRSTVIYPPVDTTKFHTTDAKEKIILSVGRFTSFFQAKKQEVLVDAWEKAIRKDIFSDWKLIFVGGLLESDQAYFQSLQQKVSGLPVQLLPNLPFDQLRQLYAKATVYWHAAGFGEKDPQRMEHFGISTVEAMASGCVPIVYNGGGLPEIVRDGKDGFLWNTTEDLIHKTQICITQKDLIENMRRDAQDRAEMFTVRKFCDAFDQLLRGMV